MYKYLFDKYLIMLVVFFCKIFTETYSNMKKNGYICNMI